MKSGPSGPKRARWRTEPHPERLRAAHPHRRELLRRHDQACEAGLSSYLDTGTGYVVLTANYLAERGFCCSQGCRHCPWYGAEPT